MGKTAIYSVAGIKSGDTYVMTGTGNGKFSPWMNYIKRAGYCYYVEIV